MALEYCSKEQEYPHCFYPFLAIATSTITHTGILFKRPWRKLSPPPKKTSSTTSTMYLVTKTSSYENSSNASHDETPAVNGLRPKPAYTVKIFPAAHIESIPESSLGEISTEVQKLYIWAAHVWHHGNTSRPISDESEDSIYRRDKCKDGCVGYIYSWTCKKGWKYGHVFVDVLCGSKCITCLEAVVRISLPRYLNFKVKMARDPDIVIHVKVEDGWPDPLFID